MDNSTDPEALVFAMYADTGHLKSLKQPMYLFLCNLFVNEIYGSTSLLPCLMSQILSDTHEISVFFCFAQIFNIHTYVAVEYGTLTILAYDRYVCICKPLHYNTLISRGKAQVVVLVIWVASFLEVGVLLSFSVRLRRCGTLINSVYCAHHLVVELSCSPDRTVSLVHDLVFGLVFSVAAPVTYIAYSYARILSVCLKASAETRVKAFDTCAPHLVSLISFVFACFYSLIAQRFNMSLVPYLGVVLSMYAIVIQPLQNPLIYGLKMSKVRRACKNLWTIKTSHLYVSGVVFL
ncbi:olfactory receptor 52L1-like isoform X2 [Betta splendens]|uniref:Olfactory receptor n=1 Tax=Betta splendens TaxID=158456 RepID=A0A9W2XHT3_BETSP|nr:olfactory receptor 52L1-like isoform X2 [Betta splendens]